MKMPSSECHNDAHLVTSTIDSSPALVDKAAKASTDPLKCHQKAPLDDESSTTSPTGSDRSFGSSDELSSSWGSCEEETQPSIASGHQPVRARRKPQCISTIISGGESGPKMNHIASLARPRGMAIASSDSSVRSEQSASSRRSVLRMHNAEYKARRNKLLQEGRSRRQSYAGPPSPAQKDGSVDARRRNIQIRAATEGNIQSVQGPQNSEETVELMPKPVIMDAGASDVNDVTVVLSPRSTPLSRKASSVTIPDSFRRLQELRASKSERETQLRQLFTHAPISESFRSVVTKPHLVEPAVYMDMKEELIRAYEVIELQKQHLSGQWQNNMVIHPPFFDSKDSSSDKAAKLQEKIVQMEQDRAYEVLELQRRLTEMSEMYKSTIDHWKRETNCWRDRFESSWEDHERTIRQLQEEKNQLGGRAQKAEQDLADFRGGADETLLDLVRAKARVHDLEEQLSLEVENCAPYEAVAEIAKRIPTYIAKAPPVAIRKNAPIETKAEEAWVSNGDNTATENTRHEHKALQASFIEDAMKRAGTRSGIMGRFSASWGLQS